MATPSVPKFAKKKVEQDKPRPRNEAEYMAGSAENIARGTKKAGRQAPAIPTRNISLNFPENLIEALDKYAKDHTGKNRSMAAVVLLSKELAL
jgi:hypothetical protein